MKRIGVFAAFFMLSIAAFGLEKEEKAAINAIKTGDIEALKSYLEKHPDLNCLFSNGKTGLYYTIVHDRSEIAEFLLRRGADPGFMIDGRSTLYWAINYNRGRIVRFLIEYGAAVNKPDKNLDTPLIYAARLDHNEICKILIDRGADPLHANRTGKRASDYAGHYHESLTYRYLWSMENLSENKASVPSMQDGPYIYWEADDLISMTYYERNQDRNFTRLIEKTIQTGKNDTIVRGFGWDKNSYHIKPHYNPNPDEVKTTGNIFAIGDIHGRYDALVGLLMNNKIIGPDLKWTFGEGHLILLGDVFDRGAEVTESLWFLHELQVQAKAAGGNVHLLLGNHEIMALTGDHRYIHDKYDYFTHYTQTYYFQLFENNSVLGRWLRSQNVIARINDYLFMHAGISPQFALYDFSYPDINDRIRAYLNADDPVEKGSPEDIILGAIGPQWYRGYMNQENGFPEVTQEFVDQYLDSKGLKRMILGHNEQPSVTVSFGGKIISADVAINESGSSAQGLLISGDKIFKCFSDGRKERLD